MSVSKRAAAPTSTRPIQPLRARLCGRASGPDHGAAVGRFCPDVEATFDRWRNRASGRSLASVPEVRPLHFEHTDMRDRIILFDATSDRLKQLNSRREIHC